ncbi:MAG TPA: isoprenylcysteine carboxylmethyltransferase family protein [Pirellulales bacterium]|jgi:protein-S-isoprenylcysteine O-methyltransferase Ste14|nr:isoprenylcysteine carboxylmethyltransferase family protein [Pirellulales bacterium]
MNWYGANTGLWIAWCIYWFVAARFTSATKKTESYFERAQHVLPLTLGMFLIFHDHHAPFLYHTLYERMPWAAVGSVVTAIGLLFAVWARVFLGKYWSGTITLKEGHRLIRGGPYRLVRHPIYTGFVTGAIGSAITMGTVDAFVGAALIAITCALKIRREERVLTDEFGDAYLQFKREVRMLVPFVV